MPPPNHPDLLARDKYPGMGRAEAEVAHAWLIRRGGEYDSIEFNVRLGEGEPCPPDTEDYLRDCWKANTQKRADIVAIAAGLVTIVEVKDRITPGAVGQLLAYQTLWFRQYPGVPVSRLLVIGRTMVSEIGEVFASQGVDIEILP